MRIAAQCANIDSFMETGINSRGRCLHGVTHKTVLAAFPRRGFHAFVIALDVLVKRGAVPAENRVIVRGKDEAEHLVFRRHRKTNQQKR